MTIELNIHMLPEKSITESLKDFDIQKKNNMCTGLISLSRDDAIKVDKNTNAVTLSKYVDTLVIYPCNESTYETLLKLHSNRKIVKVNFMSTQDIVLDMSSYASVKNTYNALREIGCKPESDDDLMRLAKKVNKKLIVTQKQLGNTAFSKSKVTEYALKVVYCHDTSLILRASLYPKEY